MLALSNLNSVRRIALIKPSALGDIAHALPILAGLRQRFPKARISWVVNKAYVPLLQGHPDLDQIIAFNRGMFARSWLEGGASFLAFLRQLRGHHFDLVLDLQGLFRSGLMTFATGAPIRLGLASAREGSRYFYTHEIEDGQKELHAVDRYWRVMEALGIESKQRQFAVPIDLEAKRWALDLLRDLPRPWLAVGVGARWLTKRWPPTHFATLIRKAQDQFGGTAIFLGAKDEAPLAQLAADLVQGSTCQLAGKTNLTQMVALLSEVDAMLSNDTGPLHIAVALGRPIVAPYTCTLIRTTGPYGQANRAVETQVWCRGSMIKQCHRLDCMDELTPDRLWPNLREILQSCPPRVQAA